MQAVCGLPGFESVSVDKKDNKMIVTGDIDPVNVVGKLRKRCHTEIVSVGPAKEEKKKEEPKKPDDKKDSAKVPDLPRVYEPCPLYYQYYYVEENPIGCVIC